MMWLTMRRRGRQKGREGVGSTWMAKCAVEADVSLAIASGEAEGGISLQGPDRNKFIH